MGRADFLWSLVGAAAVHVAALTFWGPTLGGGGAGAGGEQRITVAAASASLQSLVAEWETPPEAAATVTPLNPEALPGTEALVATSVADSRPVSLAPQSLAVVAAVGQSPEVATVAALAAPRAEPDTTPALQEMARPRAASDAPPLPDISPDQPTGAQAAPTPPDRALAKAPRPDPRPTQAAVTRRVAAGLASGLSAGQATTDATRKTTAAARAAAQAQWAAIIQSKIARHQAYPRGARQSGRVQVTMVILRNGALGEVTVARSSGARPLDQAAVHAVRRAAPFPPAPDALDDEWFRVGQWITFDRR